MILFGNVLFNLKNDAFVLLFYSICG